MRRVEQNTRHSDCEKPALSCETDPQGQQPSPGYRLRRLLREQGFYDESQAIAVKRMLAFELGRGMAKVQLTRTTMAKRMGTTRVQLDRLLNPDDSATTLQPLARAAGAVGERAKISLVKA